MRNCCPQFPTLSFDFRGDAKLHLAVTAVIHATNKLKHDDRLLPLHSQMRQQCSGGNASFKVCALPKMNQFVSGVLWLMTVQRSAKSFMQELRHSTVSAHISNLCNVVRRSMRVLVANLASGAAYSDKPIRIDSASAVSIQRSFSHTPTIIPRWGMAAGRLLDGREWNESPQDLRVREFPK